MTASTRTEYRTIGYKHFCSQHTLLLSRGQIVCRGEEALAEFLHLQDQEVTP